MNRRDRFAWVKVTWDMGPNAWTSKRAWMWALITDVWYSILGRY